MNGVRELVSIGIPVFNGEKFLESALNSVLSQTYSNLEIIIFDNASTDNTKRICEEYAAKDKRIQYHRNESNLGAARNYNLTVEHATGTYFKWAAYDDVCKPTFIEHCVQILEREPSVVLAYPKTIIVDENGKTVDDKFVDGFNFREHKSHHRFRRFTKAPEDCNAVFGVMRIEILRKTPCIGPYESSDRVLLGELALLGEIAEVPERLFLRCYHPGISTTACITRKERATWFDPNSWGRFTRLRRFSEYLKSLNRVPLSTYQRLYCLLHLILFYKRIYLEPAPWIRLAKRLRGKVEWLWAMCTPLITVAKKEVS